MENFRSYQEGHDSYFQDYISFELLLEQALLYKTRHLCTSTTSTSQSSFLQDDAQHGDILKLWPDLEEGDHHKGEKEVGGDAAEKKREGSEETVFSSTQHLCTSTSSAESCLSQECFLAELERDPHMAEKDLKQKLDRDAGEKKRKWRLRNGPEEKPLLTFELVSQYFCMPVKQAAGELNVGLTHLKRRCRELGIPRWPHRKVKSLETLIKNVQELGSNTGEEGRMTKIVVEMLQQAKKLIEERPGDVDLDQETKVLRQVCFKENYKRRRIMAIEG